MIRLEKPVPEVSKSILERRTGVVALGLGHNPAPSYWVSYPFPVSAGFPAATGRTELTAGTPRHYPPGLRRT